MTVINPEDIRCYEFEISTGEKELVCKECVDADDLNDLAKDEVILKENDERMIFCDRCDGRIP